MKRYWVVKWARDGEYLASFSSEEKAIWTKDPEAAYLFPTKKAANKVRLWWGRFDMTKLFRRKGRPVTWEDDPGWRSLTLVGSGGQFELIAYNDGHWEVNKKSNYACACGVEQNVEAAKARCLKVWKALK
jgi:hypothetical protein